mmetsp:Transcript_30432/g.49619  ORF Transcript_30432/g.49619 Transcript_30432/m.49619 type:complete len:102 (-) Transcript_30432:8-313(-)
MLCVGVEGGSGSSLGPGLGFMMVYLAVPCGCLTIIASFIILMIAMAKGKSKTFTVGVAYVLALVAVGFIACMWERRCLGSHRTVGTREVCEEDYQPIAEVA